MDSESQNIAMAEVVPGPPDSSQQGGRPSRFRFVWLALLILLATALVSGIARLGSIQQELSRWYIAGAMEKRAAEELAEAEKLLEKAQGWQPEQPDISIIRASWYEEDGQPDLAVATLEKAIETAPDRPNGYMARCTLYNNRREFARALPDCDELVRQYEAGVRQYSPIFFLSPKVLAQAKGESAEPTFRSHSIPLRPYNQRAYQRALANVDVEAGLEDVKTSIELFGNGSGVLDTRGLLHYRLEDYDQALRDMNAAVGIQRIYLRGIHDKLSGYTKQEVKEIMTEPNYFFAVILYHRMLVHEALDDSEKAEIDRAEVKGLGFEVSDSLY